MDRTKPTVLVKVIPDGKQDGVRVDVSERVLSFEYQDCEAKADAVKLTVDNGDLTAFDNPTWKKGNIMEVTWGYPGAMAPTRRCLISKVQGFAALTIEAYALSVLMNNATQSKTWEGLTRSEVAQAIAESWGYGTDLQHIQRTERVFETITQGRQSDAAFLAKLARQEGFIFYTDHQGFHFHERDVEQPPHRTYRYFTDPGRGDVIGISIENDITAKPARTRVRGRNPMERADVSAEAQGPPRLPEGTQAVEVLPDGTTRALVGWGTLAPVPETVAEGLRQLAQAQTNEAGAADAAARAAYERGDMQALRAASDQARAHRAAADQIQNMALSQVRSTREGGVTTVYPGDYDPPEETVGDFEWDASSGEPMPPEALRGEYTFAAEQYLQDYIDQHPDAQRGIPLEGTTGASRNSTEETVTTAAESQEEAEEEALVRHRRVQQTTVQMTMTVIGDPTLLAKSVVEVTGLGRRLSGKYYVTEVTHKIGQGYTCALKMRSDGTRGYGDPSVPEVAAEPRPRAPTPDATPSEPTAPTTPANPYGVPIIRRTTQNGQTVVEHQDPDGTTWTEWTDGQGRVTDSNYEDMHPNQFADQYDEGVADEYSGGGDVD